MSMIVEENVKSELRCIREHLDLSRTDVSEKAELSIRVIEKIERGQRPVRIDEAKKLGSIYNLSLDEILLAIENNFKKQNVTQSHSI